MKKVLFVSAIMCMAMAAFVACNKNDGNDPEGEGGEGGGLVVSSCMCATTSYGVTTPEVETPLGDYASCKAMQDAVNAETAAYGATIACRNK